MTWSSAFDYAVNGLIVGNIYALLAVGLALIYGVSHLINFAHGSIFMVGAYIDHQQRDRQWRCQIGDAPPADAGSCHGERATRAIEHVRDAGDQHEGSG